MSCPYYSFKDGLLFGDYWCDVKDMSVSSSQYSSYCKGYNYSNCAVYKTKNSSSGCFITTIVCNTLGMEDNVSYLQTLRNFRDNILQKNDKYKEILATYDVVGPEISCNLAHDKNREQICKNLFNLGIANVCKLLDSGEQDKAIELYTDMTNLLIQGYDIKKSYDNDYLNNMNMSKAGHGKRLVKKLV